MSNESARLVQEMWNSNKKVVRGKAVGLITKLFRNILKNPQRKKFRRLPKTKIDERLGSVVGALQLLKHVGFQPDNEHYVLPETTDFGNLVDAVEVFDERAREMAVAEANVKRVLLKMDKTKSRSYVAYVTAKKKAHRRKLLKDMKEAQKVHRTVQDSRQSKEGTQSSLSQDDIDKKNKTVLLRSAVVVVFAFALVSGFHEVNSGSWEWSRWWESSFEEVDNGVVFRASNVNVENISLPMLNVDNYTNGFMEIAQQAARIEVASFAGRESVQLMRGKFSKQAFLETCLTAFDKHLPLALRPDDVWSIIAFGFAEHVNYNAEELRHKFVAHKGKKVLEVRVDDFTMGKMSPEDWEKRVFPDFSSQIKKNIGEKPHAMLASPFSTSTAIDIAAHEITLMSTTKHYFAFRMTTLCGIPYIRLEGELRDWKALRSRAEALGEMMTETFRGQWLPHLLPLLDEFTNAYQGKVNSLFWSHIVKWMKGSGGSGSHPWISGWINNLYPYLKNGKLNKFMAPWEKWTKKPGRRRASRKMGNDPDDYPATISSANVTWEYGGTDYPLQFHAGLFAVKQDDDGFLRPQLGWVVTHDKPLSQEAQLAKLRAQLADLEAFDYANTSEREAEKQKNYIDRVKSQIQSMGGSGLKSHVYNSKEDSEEDWMY